MVLEAIPVMPPDLRPMVQLEGGRFATSTLMISIEEWLIEIIDLNV